MIDNMSAFAEWASQPFHPHQLDGNGASVDVGTRVATALEYIAAQLGEISRKLDHVGGGFSATREDFESVNELLRKLGP